MKINIIQFLRSKCCKTLEMINSRLLLLSLLLMVLSFTVSGQKREITVLFQGEYNNQRVKLFADGKLLADTVLNEVTDSLGIVASFTLDSVPGKIELRYGWFRKIEVSNFNSFPANEFNDPFYSTEERTYISFFRLYYFGLIPRQKLTWSYSIKPAGRRLTKFDRRRVFRRSSFGK